MKKEQTLITLPAPNTTGAFPIEQTLLQRRSVRKYAEKALTIQEVSQLLWAAQGITSPRGLRTAPSAGALYPLETFVAIGNVEGIDPGIYHYNPEKHSLTQKITRDKRAELSEACLGQSYVAKAPLSLILTSVNYRIINQYGERGIQYIHMEVGHVGQNIALQAVALKCGTVMIGAFTDAKVHKLLNLDKEIVPLYIIPVGKVE